jgi:hypothetical protein
MEYIEAANSPKWKAFRKNWIMEVIAGNAVVVVKGIYPALRFLYKNRPPTLTHSTNVFVAVNLLGDVKCGQLDMALGDVISTLMKFAITGSDNCIMSPNLNEETIKDAFKKLARSAAFYKMPKHEVSLPDDFELTTESFTFQPGKGLYLLVREMPPGKYQIVLADYTERATSTPMLLKEIKAQSLVNRKSGDSFTGGAFEDAGAGCVVCGWTDNKIEVETKVKTTQKGEDQDLCDCCKPLWSLRASKDNQLPSSVKS